MSFKGAISFASVTELEQWPLRNQWSEVRRNRLIKHIDSYRIVYPDRRFCAFVAQVGTETLRRGTPIETRDLWIAATALFLEAPLVTNNVRHFRV
jgi:predicted nucleic acid-binding protein